MAGILDFTGAAPRGGVLGGLNDNAMLGYLAGALQGGNLGQSIGHGLAGWLTGERLDQQRLAPAQTYRALADAGVPDAMAKAAALNPQIMKALAPAYFGREPFKDVASLNTVVGRLGDLMTAADRSAGIATASASSDPPTPVLGDVMRARDAVAEDMAHVLRSGGMSEDDIRAWKDALDASASADQLKTVLGRGIEARERASRRPASALPPRRARAARTALAQIEGHAGQAAAMVRAYRSQPHATGALIGRTPPAAQE